MKRMILPATAVVFVSSLLWAQSGTADQVSSKNREGHFDVPKMCSASIVGNPRPPLQAKIYLHSMGATLQERRSAITDAISVDNVFSKQRGIKTDLVEYLRQTASKTKIVLSDEEKSEYRKKVLDPNLVGADASGGGYGTVGTAACAHYHDGCDEVSKASFRLMHPVSFFLDKSASATFNIFANTPITDTQSYAKLELGIVSMLDVWHAAGLDSNMIIGSSRLALTVLDRVNSKVSALDRSDLYSDAITAFKSLNVSDAEAERLSLTLLGLYGTRGSAIATSLLWATESNLAFYQSMVIISSAASYLDGLTWQSGKAYSLPRGTSFYCDETRSYHFWLPAFLAYTFKDDQRRALYSDQHLDPISIFDGLHVLNTLYKMKATVSTQRLRDNPGASDILSSFAVETDKDLVLNDAGALWVLRDANQKKPINMNAALESIFEGTSHVKRNFLQQIVDFDGWARGFLQPWRDQLAR